MARKLVFVEGRYLCGEEPAWLLLDTRFVRFSRTGLRYYHRVEVAGVTYECVEAPRFPVIVRVRSGWYRRGRDRYYMYEPDGTVRKLRRYAVKDIHTKEWKVCAEDDVRGETFCFRLTDKGIVLEAKPVRLSFDTRKHHNTV